ncbi:MAG: hypothetical protein V4471_01980 [Pseudomonadota bacterium]
MPLSKNHTSGCFGGIFNLRTWKDLMNPLGEGSNSARSASPLKRSASVASSFRTKPTRTRGYSMQPEFNSAQNAASVADNQSQHSISSHRTNNEAQQRRESESHSAQSVRQRSTTSRESGYHSAQSVNQRSTVSMSDSQSYSEISYQRANNPVQELRELERLFATYLNILHTTTQVELGIANSNESPESLSAIQKKRAIFQRTAHHELQKRSNEKKMQADTSLYQLALSGPTQTRLNAIMGVGGFATTFSLAVNPALGIGLAAATTMIYVGYLAVEVIKARQNRVIARKLQPYLPQDGSDILNVISSLLVLLVKDNLDTELQIRHARKFKFDHSHLKQIIENIFNGSAKNDITASWSREEKAVCDLAQKYAKKLFANLIKYSENNENGKAEINRDIYKTLIPGFVQNNGSVLVTQNRVILTAWLGALSMLVAEEPPHHQELFYAEISNIRRQVDGQVMELEMELEMERGSSHEEAASITSSRVRGIEKSRDWVNRPDFSSAKSQSDVSLNSHSSRYTPLPAMAYPSSPVTSRSGSSRVRLLSSESAESQTGTSTAHTSPALPRRNSARYSTGKSDLFRPALNDSAQSLVSIPTSYASSLSRQSSVRSSHASGSVASHTSSTLPRHRPGFFQPVPNNSARSQAGSVASQSSYTPLDRDNARSPAMSATSKQSVYTSYRP